jgi:hypothetical protein
MEAPQKGWGCEVSIEGGAALAQHHNAIEELKNGSAIGKGRNNSWFDDSPCYETLTSSSPLQHASESHA